MEILPFSHICHVLFHWHCPVFGAAMRIFIICIVAIFISTPAFAEQILPTPEDCARAEGGSYHVESAWTTYAEAGTAKTPWNNLTCGTVSPHPCDPFYDAYWCVETGVPESEWLFHMFLWSKNGEVPPPPEPDCDDWDSDGMPDKCDPEPYNAYGSDLKVLLHSGPVDDICSADYLWMSSGVSLVEVGTSSFDNILNVATVGTTLTLQEYESCFCSSCESTTPVSSNPPGSGRAQGIVAAQKGVEDQISGLESRIVDLESQLNSLPGDDGLESSLEGTRNQHADLKSRSAELDGELIGAIVEAIEKGLEEEGTEGPDENLTYDPTPTGDSYSIEGEFAFGERLNSFMSDVKTSQLFSLPADVLGTIPGGGDPVMSFDGGMYGEQSLDLSDFSPQLAIIRSVLLVAFSFVAIRIVILKR